MNQKKVQILHRIKGMFLSYYIIKQNKTNTYRIQIFKLPCISGRWKYCEDTCSSSDFSSYEKQCLGLSITYVLMCLFCFVWWYSKRGTYLLFCEIFVPFSGSYFGWINLPFWNRFWYTPIKPKNLNWRYDFFYVGSYWIGYIAAVCI